MPFLNINYKLECYLKRCQDNTKNVNGDFPPILFNNAILFLEKSFQNIQVF